MPPARVFISYSSSDEQFRADLDRHLALLKREGAVETWTFRNIEAGTDWKSQIDGHLEAANIIVFLVSANFIASDYCWNIEMRRALQRHREGSARVVPVIIRDCDWASAPFAAIQALPPAAKPVTAWRPRDKAWAAVAEGLRVITRATEQPTTAESVSPVPESAVQRAQRLAADSRARQARQDKLRGQGIAAARIEVESVFKALEQQANEITVTTDLTLEAGWRLDHCIVRLKPLSQNIVPLTLHLYPYFNPHEIEESHLNVRLLFGGMVLPQESGKFYLEEPKEHTKDRYKFRLSAEGQWLWEEPVSSTFLTSEQLANHLLTELLQLHDDVEAGNVKQPDFW